MSTDNAGDGLQEAVEVTCKKFPTGWLCDVVCHNPAHDEFLHPAAPAEVKCPKCHRPAHHNPCPPPRRDRAVLVPAEPDAGDVALTDDGQANTCTHQSATGIDTTPINDPDKVWRCDHCGFRWPSGDPADSAADAWAEIAAREREAAARAGERIAKAIEASIPIGRVQKDGYRRGLQAALLIARAEARP